MTDERPIAPPPRLDPERARYPEALERARDGKFYEDYDRAGSFVGIMQTAHDAMQRFCDRVEAGEVRSQRTYAEFCEILGRPNKAQPVPTFSAPYGETAGGRPRELGECD